MYVRLASVVAIGLALALVGGCPGGLGPGTQVAAQTGVGPAASGFRPNCEIPAGEYGGTLDAVQHCADGQASHQALNLNLNLWGDGSIELNDVILDIGVAWTGGGHAYIVHALNVGPTTMFVELLPTEANSHGTLQLLFKQQDETSISAQWTKISTTAQGTHCTENATSVVHR